MLWTDFSAWLLAVGLAMGVVAGVIGLVLLIARRRARGRPAWPVALGSLFVLALALFNNMVHSRDAWTSVMPLGLALSAVTVIAILATAWIGFSPQGAVAGPYRAEAPISGVAQ